MPTDSAPGFQWGRLATAGLRAVVGGVFTFSGFVKAIDPYGTLYKVNEYLSVLSLHLWPSLVLVGVFCLCALELVIGVCVLTGCFRRMSPWAAAAVMVFMLPLSLWIAVADPVADCGCFGDALVISNWATFWKNVVLSFAVWLLIRRNRRLKSLVTPALQWIALVATVLFAGCIEAAGYAVQPLVDFRGYPVGSRLVDQESYSEGSPRFEFIYERNGERRSFGEEDVLPDENEGWIFVERKEIAPATPSEGDRHTFRAYSKDGSEDLTDDAVVSSGREILVLMPALGEVSPATTWKLNSLEEWSRIHGVMMAAVVAGDEREIDEWEDLSMASYPIYTADDTQIKEVARGNPAVVYLSDGVIRWKSALASITIDDFLQPGTPVDPETFGHDTKALLRNLVALWISVLAVLVLLSYIPTLRHLFSARGKTIHDDKAHREESSSPDTPAQ